MESLQRLVVRNREQLLEGGRIEWFNPPDAACLTASGLALSDLEVWQQDFAACRRLRNSGIPAAFGDFPSSDKSPSQVFLFLPREKERLAMLAHWAANRLPEDGVLWLVGAKRAGIGSSPRHLEAFFAQVEKVDSAGHGALIRASQVKECNAFDKADYCREWTLDTGPGDVRIHSWPGVFSHGALDHGTALLLTQLAKVPKASSVLDFGCGAGVISAAMLAANPGLDITLLDSSALALLAARTTLSANGMQGTMLASDGFSEVTASYDLIVSNPPFHEGHRQKTSLGQDFVREAGQRLKPGGHLMIVVNRHLPYRSWLSSRFRKHEVVAADTRYQILLASGP
jgi:16S rRNA (guanine1207-N2)-methyltransferase